MPGVLNRQGEPPVAVIDIGSNSIRLVVYSRLERAPLPLFNEKVLCGLGRSLDATGRMPEEAITLAMQSLHRFVSLTNSLGVTHIEAVATAAVRIAENGPAFIARIAHECGLSVTVLSGQQEARFSGLGVLSGIPAADGIAGDLGGGSIELVKIAEGQIAKRETLPFGTLRLLESGIAVKDMPKKLFDPQLKRLPWLQHGQERVFYAVGGTWRALARIHMEHKNYPLRVLHGYRIPARDVAMIADIAATKPATHMAQIEGFARQRTETVVPAARLLESLVQASGVKEVMISALGLREGCLFAKIPKQQRSQDPLIAMCIEMTERMGRQTADGELLWRWTAAPFKKYKARTARLRLAACHLADIGWSEHPDYRAEQVFLRILRMPLSGIDHSERTMLAIAVASRHAAMDGIIKRWGVGKLLTKKQKARAQAIGMVLRLAYTVSGGAIRLLEEISLTRKGKELTLTVPDYERLLVSDVVERRFRALADIVGCKPVVHLESTARIPRQAAS